MKNFFAQFRRDVVRLWSLFITLTPWLRPVVVISGVVLTLVIGVFWVFVLVSAEAFGALPTKSELQKIVNPLASEIYSADGVLIGKYYIQERSNISYEDIEGPVEETLLATEDVRFYQHNGVDFRGLGRVLFKTLLLQQSAGGGSTLSQQLAKNLFPREDFLFFPLLVNKVREIIIAFRLESALGKKEILTLYLNTVPFSENAYGIETAAQRFFSKSTDELNYAESAVLIGMLKATHNYNPRLFPDRTLQRRNTVLSQLAKYHFITRDEAVSLRDTPLNLKYNRLSMHSGVAPYFREMLRQQLLDWCANHVKDNGEPYNLYTDGLKVHTTLDSKLQHYAEDAVRKKMRDLQHKFEQHWQTTKPWVTNPAILKEAIYRADPYQKLKKLGLTESSIMEALRQVRTRAVFSYEGGGEAEMSVLDSIKRQIMVLNAGMLAIDPRNGAVRVWVGGVDHEHFQFDHVKVSTKRQVGSVFKPILYAAAIKQGMSPCDYISGSREVYVDGDKQWVPRNVDDQKYDKNFSLTGALAYSVNTVSVKILQMIGVQNVVQMARQLGISSVLPRVPSLALGTANISMEEMTGAYAAFVNDGVPVKSYYITHITTSTKDTIASFYPAKLKAALTPVEAHTVRNMLEAVVDHGTARSLKANYDIPVEIGGKTGTTQANADGWFIAITPTLVIGAWVGADDPRVRFRSTALGQGSATALPLVGEFMQRAMYDRVYRSRTKAYFQPLPEDIAAQFDCDLIQQSSYNFFERLFERKKEVLSTKALEKERSEGSSLGSRSIEKKDGKIKRVLKKLFGKFKRED